MRPAGPRMRAHHRMLGQERRPHQVAPSYGVPTLPTGGFTIVDLRMTSRRPCRSDMASGPARSRHSSTDPRPAGNRECHPVRARWDRLGVPATRLSASDGLRPPRVDGGYDNTVIRHGAQRGIAVQVVKRHAGSGLQTLPHRWVAEKLDSEIVRWPPPGRLDFRPIGVITTKIGIRTGRFLTPVPTDRPGLPTGPPPRYQELRERVGTARTERHLAAPSPLGWRFGFRRAPSCCDQ